VLNNWRWRWLCSKSNEWA